MAIAYDDLLVLLDGSEFAERALPYAVQMARDCRAKLHLLSVAEGNPDTIERIIGFTWLGQENRVEEETSALITYLDGVEQQLSAETNPPSIITNVADGEITQTILDYIAANSCDAIIMATRGRSDIAQIVVGSTAEDLVRVSPIPVMLVR